MSDQSLSKAIGKVFLAYQHCAADLSPIVLIEKARRIGISWGVAGIAVLFAAKATGDNVWYMGYNKDMAKGFIADCGWWVKKFQMAVDSIEEGEFVELLENGDEKKIQTFTVKFASGFKITALASCPRNLRSIDGWIILDEASFISDLAAIIGAALATRTWGGRIMIISTHNGVDSYFNELVENTRAGKLPFKLYRITLSDAVADGLYQRICLVTKQRYSKEAEEAWIQSLYDAYPDKAVAAEELDVIPRSGSDVYLSRALIESVTQPDIPIVRLALESSFLDKGMDYRTSWMQDWCATYLKPVLTTFNSRLNHYLGADFARSGDLTVIWILAEQPDLHLSTALVVELRNIPFDEQKQLMLYLCKRIPKFMSGAVDGRGNGEYIAETMDQMYSGIFYRTNDKPGVRATVEFYRQAMPRMKARFEDKSLTIPRDSNILADLRSITLDKGVAKIPDNLHIKDTSGGMRHGDAAIALLMAIWASIQDVSVYAYHPAIYPTDSTRNNYQSFLRPPPDEDRPTHGSGIKTSINRWKD